MSWVAPLFLAALPILGLPILLHLWKKRRRETLPWGAMQFLVSQTQQQRRLSNIDRWLVLLARCLILLFLICALAQPLLHSEKYGTLQNQTDDVLIIDNSLSTSRSSGEGSAIEQIRTAAIQWAETRPRGASIRVLMAAGRPQWLTEQVQSADLGVNTLVDKIAGIRPAAARCDLVSALRFAATTELSETADNITKRKRRVWLLTDGQSTDWGFSSDEAMQAFCQELEAETHVQISAGIVAVEQGGANLAVSPLVSDGWRRAPGEKVRMTARITNFGSDPSPIATAVWKVGDNEVSREPIEILQPGESKQVEAIAYLQRPGTHIAACEINIDDQLVADNRSVAVIETLQRVPVLLVCDRKPNPRSLDDADFFAAAMGLSVTETKRKRHGGAGQEAKRWNTIFDARRVTSTDLAELNLDEFDSIVLLDPPPISTDRMQKIADYVNRGGGLWILLGDQTNIDSFNQDWYAGGLGLSPIPLRSLSLVELDESANADDEDADIPDSRIHTPQRDHPTVYWLSDSGQSDLDEVLIRRFYSVRRPNVDSDVRTLLRTGGGNPLAMLGTAGKGRVIVQTLPMQSSWTNWPLTGSFVVMVDSWLRYVTEPRQSILNLQPGNPLRLRVPVAMKDSSRGRAANDSATIQRPDGEIATALAVRSGNVRELRYSQTFESGIYEVAWPERHSRTEGPVAFTSAEDRKRAELQKAVFSVSRPIEESRAALVTEEFVTTFNGVSSLAMGSVAEDTSKWIRGPVSDDPHASVVDETPKLPIWTPLLWALVAFLVAELLLASYASIRRFGRNIYQSDSQDDLDIVTTVPVSTATPDEVAV